MSSRSSAIRMGTTLSCLLALGCPANTPSGTDQVTTDAVKPPTIPLGSPVGVGVKGTVTGPGGTPLAAANITVDDARILEVPNSGHAVTAADGTYSLRPVPSGSAWFVVAEVNGNRMAGLVKPVVRRDGKDSQCDINMGTTLAVAGLAPFFAADPGNFEKVVLLLNDMSPSKFADLAAAVTATNPTAKPSAKLRDLNATFTDIRDKNPAVKSAYDALFADIQAQAAIRQAGGTPIPTSSGASSSATPTTAASTVTLAQGSADPIATFTAVPPTGGPPTPVPSPTPTPAPVVFSPYKVATLSGTLPDAFARVGMPNAPVGSGLIPTASFLLALVGTGTATNSLDLALLAGGKPPAVNVAPDTPAVLATALTFDGVKGPYSIVGALAVDGSIATGKRISMQIAGLVASDFQAITVTNGIAYVSTGAKNSILRVDLVGGDGTAQQAGQVGTASGYKDGPGIDALFNSPTGVCASKGKIYIADSGNNCIRVLSTTDASIKTVAGAPKAGSADGVATAASFNNPTDIVADEFGNLYIADKGNNLIRKISIPDGTVTTVAGSGTAASTDGVATAAAFSAPSSLGYLSASTPLGSGHALVVIDSGSKQVRLLTSH